MSKTWFLEIAQHAEPSPLAGAISRILNPSSRTKHDKSVEKLSEDVRNQ